MNLLPFVASGLGLGGIYALASVGLVILYRASGTLNFAFGAFGCLSAFLAWDLSTNADIPAPIGWADRDRGLNRARLCLWAHCGAAHGAPGSRGARGGHAWTRAIYSGRDRLVLRRRNCAPNSAAHRLQLRRAVRCAHLGDPSGCARHRVCDGGRCRPSAGLHPDWIGHARARQRPQHFLHDRHQGHAHRLLRLACQRRVRRGGRNPAR